MSKKVLVITYYWPPAAGVPVLRWLNFCKHLPTYGLTPVILTVSTEKASYQLAGDTALECPDMEVIRTSSFEWISLFFRDKKRLPGLGAANPQKDTWIKRLARFVRGNIFIPDPRRGWNQYALREAHKMLKKEMFSAVVTTGPPHSTHLIGLKLKRKFAIPWLADFRDPWTQIFTKHYFFKLPVTDAIEQKMERRVLKVADAVLVVSRQMKKQFAQLYPSLSTENIHVLTNGYEAEAFEGFESQPRKEFTLLFAGTLNYDEVFRPFFLTLQRFKKEVTNHFKLLLMGAVSTDYRSLIKEYELEQNVSICGFRGRKEVMEQLGTAHLGVYLTYRTEELRAVLSTKIFEYLAARKPIIGITYPDAEAADFIRSHQAGDCFDHDDTEGIFSFLKDHCINYDQKVALMKTNEGYKNYSRKVLTGELARIINDMTRRY